MLGKWSTSGASSIALPCSSIAGPGSLLPVSEEMLHTTVNIRVFHGGLNGMGSASVGWVTSP